MMDGKMYFWNINAAADALRDDLLSDWDKYLIATLSFQMAQAAVGRALFVAKIDPLGLLGYAFAIALMVSGLVWLFRINTRAGGRDFVARYIVLSLPVSVRLAAAYWILALSLSVASSGSPPASSIFWKLLPFVALPAYVLAFFWQMRLGLARLLTPTAR